MRLLERPEYADFWALKWSDLLRNEERALDRKGVQNFHHWIRAERRREQAARSVRARIGRRPRQHLHQSAGQLLPRQSRPRHPRRGDRASLPRRAPASAPSATITRSTAGRRMTITAGPMSSPASTTRCWKTAARDNNDSHEFIGEQIVYEKSRRRSERPAPGRIGQAAAARGVQSRVDADHDRLDALADWITSPRQSVLRPGAGQPDLVPPDGPRAGRSGRRFPPDQSGEPSGIARCAGERFRRSPLRRALHHPADHEFAGLRAVIRAERNQRRR